MTYEQAEAKALAASKAGFGLKMWQENEWWHWTWKMPLANGVTVQQLGSTNAAPKGVALIFALEQI
jgi:hypothetical protein